jgi:hypothetical protein
MTAPLEQTANTVVKKGGGRGAKSPKKTEKKTKKKTSEKLTWLKRRMGH